MSMCQMLQGSSGHRPVLETLPSVSLLRGFIRSLCALRVFPVIKNSVAKEEAVYIQKEGNLAT